MKYRHELAEDAVKALVTGAADHEIATALADYLLAGALIGHPFKLAINHNAKVAPCPLRIDRPGAKQSYVTLDHPAAAGRWIIEALTRGYEVTATTHKGIETRSIASERRSHVYREQMATYRAKVASGEIAEDDDIPF